MTNENKEGRFAGLPESTGPLPPPSVDQRVGRPTVTFALPRSAVGMTWNLDDRYLTFSMGEVTPREQAEAVRLAGSPPNPSLLTQEIIFKVILSVGDLSTPVKHRDWLENWWKAIGPKGRRFVEAAFMRLSSPTEQEIETFLAAAIPT